MLRACHYLLAPRNQRRVVTARCLSSYAATAEEIEEANERYRGSIEIRQTTDNRGWGLFALCSFCTGDQVMSARSLKIETERGMYTIQTDWDVHVVMDLPARLVNHVCGVANLGIRDNELGAYDFLALKDIQAGQELTWDYETAEFEMGGFKCTCGSPVCRRVLRGFRANGSRVRALHGNKFIASYLTRDT